MIAPGHSHVTKNKLREEGQVETKEDKNRRDLSPVFGIQPAGNLGPPVMQATHESHNCAAHHDVVEVGDHKVGIGEMNVHPHTRQEQSGQAADGEEPNESETVEHRSGKLYGALIHG